MNDAQTCVDVCVLAIAVAELRECSSQHQYHVLAGRLAFTLRGASCATPAPRNRAHNKARRLDASVTSDRQRAWCALLPRPCFCVGACCAYTHARRHARTEAVYGSRLSLKGSLLRSRGARAASARTACATSRDNAVMAATTRSASLLGKATACSAAAVRTTAAPLGRTAAQDTAAHAVAQQLLCRRLAVRAARLLRSKSKTDAHAVSAGSSSAGAATAADADSGIAHAYVNVT
jgi:hypothetical protein